MNDDGPILVTGANGFIGSHLVDHLIAGGNRVRALVRARSDRRFLNPAAEPVVGDLSSPLRLLSLLEGVKVVYHVAGVVATYRDRTYFEVNEAGTRTLVAVCRRAAPDLRRFVLVSSLAAAGPSRHGTPVRETDPPRPVSRYGLSKLRGEQAARAAAGPIPVTIVRPPAVYGPRDRDMLTFFVMARKDGLPRFRREKYYSILHVRDLVRGIVLAGSLPVAAGRTYHLADARAYAMSHLFDLIADAADGGPRRTPVPEGLLRIVGQVADVLAPALRLPSRPLADKIRELAPDAWIADPGRAARELGFRTKIALADGIRETARFYLEREWLPLRRR